MKRKHNTYGRWFSPGTPASSTKIKSSLVMMCRSQQKRLKLAINWVVAQFVVDKEVVEALNIADTQEVAVAQEVHSMIDIRRMLTEPLGVKKKPGGVYEELNEQVSGEFQAGRLK